MDSLSKSQNNKHLGTPVCMLRIRANVGRENHMSSPGDKHKLLKIDPFHPGIRSLEKLAFGLH